MYIESLQEQDAASEFSPTGRVKTISKSIDSDLEPVEIFQKFNEQSSSKNRMLLESSDIGSREHLKSIILLQAAIRIECNGSDVRLNALTQNGQNALLHIVSRLNHRSMKVEKLANSRSISVHYSKDNGFVDEDSRLKQISSIDILRTIRESFCITGNSDYSIFLSGMFSYDLIASFESLPEVDNGSNSCPDYVFYLAESLLVIDHQQNQKRFLCNHFSTDKKQSSQEEKTYFELARSFDKLESQLRGFQPPKSKIETELNNFSADCEISVDVSDLNYQAIVKQLKQNIVGGDIFQVVPSRSYSLRCHSPIESYKALKQANPSPYLFFMSDQDFSLFGASPESALKYDHQSNQVELYPIAGTRPRGKKESGEIDLDLDARIETELKLDQKEVSEHMMLVDLARNDIARISLAGTTHVPKLLNVDKYSQVMHLVSCVKGSLRHDLDALHAYQACMNMGTLTGAPKIKATELIRKVEGKRRGSYGGAVGYLNGKGDMDTCIVIRSAFYRDGIAHIQAGAGIVYDSNPVMEAEETYNKAKAVINAIVYANQQFGGAS